VNHGAEGVAVKFIGPVPALSPHTKESPSVEKFAPFSLDLATVRDSAQGLLLPPGQVIDEVSREGGDAIGPLPPQPRSIRPTSHRRTFFKEAQRNLNPTIVDLPSRVIEFSALLRR
jgi:hypothetical protein